MAARYLRVPPWELEKQPTYWRDRALVLRNAEAKAEHERREMAKYHWR